MDTQTPFLEEIIALRNKNLHNSSFRCYEDVKNQIRRKVEKDPSKTIWGISFERSIDGSDIKNIKKMLEQDGFIVVVDDLGPEDMLVSLPLGK